MLHLDFFLTSEAPEIIRLMLYFGAFFELVGIALLAAPDFLPGIRRSSRWVGHRVARWRRAVPNLLRRLRGQPRRHDVHVGAASIRASASISARAIRGHSATAPTREILAYLLDRDEKNQETAYRLDDTDEAIRQSIETLRSEIDSLIEAKIYAAGKDFQAARVVGALALFVGLILTVLA